MKPPPSALADQGEGTHARFQDTRWTLVIQGKDGAAEAMESLCRTYWYPLYAFARRSGLGPANAQDVTQGFFLRLLEKDVLQHVDRAKGRFRNFLLSSIQNFLHNERDRSQAAKRGSGKVLEWDALEPEQRYALEPADQLSGSLFDTAWAVALIQNVLQQLRSDYVEKGKGQLFDALRPYLAAEVPPGQDTTLAEALALNVNTLKSERLRLRREYGEQLKSEIRQTLQNPTEQEVRDELRHLLAAIATRS